MTQFSPTSISGTSAPTPVTGDLPDDVEDAVQSEVRQVSVPLGGHGQRVDRALADAVPEFSRSYLQQLIDLRMVKIDGHLVAKASLKVKAGELLTVELRPTPQSQAFKPEMMALDVVFEDEYLCVINKPAGLVVHPAPGNWSGTLLNGLLARDRHASDLPRAGIVHRLDKDTSGLMVVAKQRQTMDQLVTMIAAREVSREYLALANGIWQGSRTRQIESPVGRDPRNRLRMAVVDLEKNSGKPASTQVTLLDTAGLFSLVRCKLHTGRTHQIRVHLSDIGHPLVADAVYGGAPAGGLNRQALHACRLGFTHPVTGETMVFIKAPPSDMSSAIDSIGLRYNPT
ncbi:MAG: RluA family pseudouridine synthase [Polaromonas sp.]|nr:RluA family pseudouridine synthase [Polaromonas sp.]